MTCERLGGVIVCRPSDEFLRKRYRRCPVCECTTEMVERHEPWYGRTVMCCRCGDSWSDGELHERPFARGWRARSVRRYRVLWMRAGHGPDPTFEELYPEFEQVDGPSAAVSSETTGGVL